MCLSTLRKRRSLIVLFIPSWWLFDGIKVSIGAPEIDYAVHDQWSGKDRADVELPIGRDGRRFPPIRVVKEWLVEFPVGREDPAVVLLRCFRLEIPEWLGRFKVARLQRSVEDADQNHVARHDGRRKHVSVVLLFQQTLARGGIDDLEENGIGRGEDNFADNDSG